MEDFAEAATLQRSITNDLETLGVKKGELASFAEYRLNSDVNRFHSQLKDLMNKKHQNKELLMPLVSGYLAQLKKVNDYYWEQRKQLGINSGQADDADIMMQLSTLEGRRDVIYSARYAALEWAGKLGVEVGDETERLTTTLMRRGNRFSSMARFTQEKLKEATKELSKAGEKATDAQRTLVAQLTKRLAQTSASLSLVIDLLDDSDKDTSALKKALLSASGEITQDVLNVKVVKGLADGWLDSLSTLLIEHGPDALFKLFVFISILFATYLLSKGVGKMVRVVVGHSKMRLSRLLVEFIVSLSRKIVLVIGALVALSQLGIQMGALLAGFGVVGVIIGFALQDTLANFASGLMILIYRPYDVGDLISTGGVTGVVSHMSLVSTIVKTLDNQRLIIPNNRIWCDTINNRTIEGRRRVDMTFGIGYSENIEKAEAIFEEIILAHPLVLEHPEPMVKVHQLGESSVDFVVRPWVKPDDYWPVYWDVTRAVKVRFDEEGIVIPFPQRDVHIYKTTQIKDEGAV
ncbi:mechanosensitive ion channel family protein [Sinobacterium caligoides]|nr:mechanosensitive ion channel family protein [Sinobacterium caligoides]